MNIAFWFLGLTLSVHAAVVEAPPIPVLPEAVMPAPALAGAPARIQQTAAAPVAAAAAVASPAQGGEAQSAQAAHDFDNISAAATASASDAAPIPQAAFQEALTQTLQEKAGGLVIGWRTPHVEKAAFPYQVERQRRIYQPVAQSQILDNQTRFASVVANPDLARMIFSSALGRATKRDVPLPELADPAFGRFFDLLGREAARVENFSKDGALVNVGWGNGDHVNGRGRVPLAGDSAARSVAYRLAGQAYSEQGPFRSLLDGKPSR